MPPYSNRPDSTKPWAPRRKGLLSAILSYDSRDNDASAKTLVFSQFKRSLLWLQSELPKHGFGFRTITGDMSKTARTRALRDFREAAQRPDDHSVCMVEAVEARVQGGICL